MIRSCGPEFGTFTDRMCESKGYDLHATDTISLGWGILLILGHTCGSAVGLSIDPRVIAGNMGLFHTSIPYIFTHEGRLRVWKTI